jgi:rare lipoprotein A
MRRTLIAMAVIVTLVVPLMLLNPLRAAAQLSGGTETGTAACYSRHLVGHRTSSGQRYNPNALTAAHATILIGTKVKLTDIENGRTVIVTVNDRLSAHASHDIIMDISHRACEELKFPRGGEAEVKIEEAGADGSAAAHQANGCAWSAPPVRTGRQATG